MMNPKEKICSNTIDLRGVKCPMNFVKAKIAIDKVQALETIEFFLDVGEPVDNVSESLIAEGHAILCKESVETYVKLVVQKHSEDLHDG